MPPDPVVPASLGKYELRGTLGKGAMGVVYDAWDPAIERRVAVKTIRLPAAGDEVAEEEWARFKREAQAAGRLNHPGIVGVYDYGDTDGVAYIAMELVEGQSLKALLDKEGRLTPATTVRVMRELLDALAYSHARGIIHRDIKPTNLIVTPTGAIKITDFGIARIESNSVTQMGTVMGTPAYMSPEQFMGQTVDVRSDIYAAGVVLFQLLTGERPFDGGLTAIMHKVLHTTPPKPSDLSVTAPEAFDAVVACAMARRPEDRYPSAEAFAAAIAEAATGRTAATAPPAQAAEDATLVVPARRLSEAVPGPPPPPFAIAPASTGRPGIALLGGIAALVLLALAAAAFFVLRPGEQQATKQSARVATADSPSAPGSSVVAPPPAAPPASQAASPPNPSPPTLSVPTLSVPTLSGPTPSPPTPTLPASPAPVLSPPIASPPAATATERPGDRPASIPMAPAAPTPPPLAQASPALPASPSPPPAMPSTAPPVTAPSVPAASAPEPARPSAAPVVLGLAEPPPAPAPPRLPPAAASVRDIACTLLDIATGPGGGIVVTGLAGRGSPEAAAREAVAKVAGQHAPEWQVTRFEGPYCDVVDTLRRIRNAQPGVTGSFELSLKDGQTRFKDGEWVRPLITAPFSPAHLQLLSFQSDRTMFRLYPDAHAPDEVLAPGSAVPVGDPRNHGFQVGSPFGHDMLVALMTSEPMPARGDSEPIETRLAALQRAAEQIVRGGGFVLSRAVPVQTVRR